MISKTCVASSFSSHIFWEKENHGFSQKCQSFRSYSCHDYGIIVCKSTWTSRYSFLNVGDQNSSYRYNQQIIKQQDAKSLTLNNKST